MVATAVVAALVAPWLRLVSALALALVLAPALTPALAPALTLAPALAWGGRVLGVAPVAAVGGGCLVVEVEGVTWSQRPLPPWPEKLD